MPACRRYNPGMPRRKEEGPTRPPGSRRRQATPAEQGLHPVSLILSGPLYEGLRLYCFTNRKKHQELLRKLLGEFLASKGIVRVVHGQKNQVRYELTRPPAPPLP
jgi:hypothetical protein